MGELFRARVVRPLVGRKICGFLSFSLTETFSVRCALSGLPEGAGGSPGEVSDGLDGAVVDFLRENNEGIGEKDQNGGWKVVCVMRAARMTLVELLCTLPPRRKVLVRVTSRMKHYYLLLSSNDDRHRLVMTGIITTLFPEICVV